VLDEFQVTDVADAMILGRLFEKLLASGAVIVLTSNTAADDLYEGGLNRQLFLPFIALIKERLEMVELNGPRDYRLEGMTGVTVYNTPLGPEADAAMDAAWRQLTDGATSQAVTLEVLERKILVPQAAVAWRDSPSMRSVAKRWAPRTISACAEFSHLLIDGIPRLGPDQSNEARRFTILIDTLYDEKVKLVCSAASTTTKSFTRMERMRRPFAVPHRVSWRCRAKIICAWD